MWRRLEFLKLQKENVKTGLSKTNSQIFQIFSTRWRPSTQKISQTQFRGALVRERPEAEQNALPREQQVHVRTLRARQEK